MPPPPLSRVLLTGASGTLGCNIAKLLASTHPHTEVFLLMRSPDPDLFAGCKNVRFRKADMLNPSELQDAVADLQPNAIIHCAASGVRPSGIGWFDLINLNVASTLQLFEASCRIEDCHFIHVSTGLVYREQDRLRHEDDPIDTLHPYGASKAAADCLLRAGADRLKRRLTVVRPFSFTGLHDGGDRLFPSLLRNALANQPFEMSQGSQYRDFCAVQDVAEAICLILDTGAAGGTDVFNLGSGRFQTLRCTVETVCRELELEVDIRYGVKPFHIHEPMHLVADIERATSLGWRPRTNLSYAVWQLAQTQYPELRVREPKQFYP